MKIWQQDRLSLKRLPEHLFWLGIFLTGIIFSCNNRHQVGLTDKEQLGKLIFFDEQLSEPVGQSCATCHTPERGFSDKDMRVVSEGAVKGLFSNRNSITCAYSAYVPPLGYNAEDETYAGGLFWDGRANTLSEQARLPFINPVEMGNADSRMVARKIRQADYYPLLVEVYGHIEYPDTLFNAVADAIATYERSAEVNPFSSKYDAYVDGKCQLTEEETRGMELFRDKGLCAECHIMEADPRARRVLFTDHTYDNLGIPANPDNPFYAIPVAYNPNGRDTIDLGLGVTLHSPSENGKFRVPTMRNVVLTAPYGHNGFFRTLEDIVHFYNVRDVSGEYPVAEYPETVNQEELGNLKLTPDEEASLVAFLKTLTDGYSN